MNLKTLSKVLLLGVLSTNIFAENNGTIIPLSTLLKNPSKMDYAYSSNTGICELTTISFKDLWKKYDFPKSNYKDTKSIISFFNSLHKDVNKKDLIARTGFDNKSLTTLEDSEGITYLYFNTLQNCLDTAKVLSETKE